jgi:hypothetical protein
VTVNKYALAAAFALCFSAAAQAAVIDLVPASQGQTAQAQPARMLPVPDLAVSPGVSFVMPSTRASELPEPEVFAMMLVGLVLIGYRASRDSSEKFK